LVLELRSFSSELLFQGIYSEQTDPHSEILTPLMRTTPRRAPG
jgi:hypothetical protein